VPGVARLFWGGALRVAAVVFFAAAFLVAVFFVAVDAGALFAADFFAGDFVVADFFAGDFVVADFFAGALLAADFFVAVFFAAAFFAGAFFAALRPLPLRLPPPSCLLTVAHAMRSAVLSLAPRARSLSSMCSAWRFCLSV
ncbi:hypothetical protein, partial [Stenotrophomonas sp. S41]|uniref:hypothetical protein n=1 Tax=Stenotrophomonas sp. S41 TaxID=2767464 RepID=UPI00190C2877